MASTTARRSPTIFTSTCAVGAMLFAACSGGDDVPTATLAEPAPVAAPAPVDSSTVPAVEEPEPTVPPTDPTDPTSTERSDAPTATTPAATTAPADADDDADDGSEDGDDTALPPDDGTATASTTPPSATSPVDTTTDPGAADVDWSGIVTDLLDQQFRIPREPSLDLVRAVCVEPSGCFDDAAGTVEVLLRDGVRLRGGAPFEVVSVEFQGTVDDSPVDSALAVNVIVRFVATEQGVVQLVDDNGDVVSDVAPDDRFTPGQPATRAVILGRDGAGAGWKLVALSDWM